MTALKQYERLEATALWRAAESAQRREVFVSFGDTSLIIRDRLEAPLSHWSLPAVARLNPGRTPALFATSGDTHETLEIEDETMVLAIETVRAAIERRRPRPGRLRFGILALFSVAILLLVVFWLPGALQRHVLRVLPDVTRAEIGARTLSRISRLTGQACTTPKGERALETLNRRLLPDQQARILVLPEGIAKSASLPGGIIVLNRKLLEDFQTPDVAAGYILLSALQARQHDPLADLLDYAGGLSAFRLLTSGRLTDATLKSYAQFVLTRAPAMPGDDQILDLFEKAGMATSPLAYAIDETGETTLSLIEGDPFRDRGYAPLLGDPDWISLQGICEK